MRSLGAAAPLRTPRDERGPLGALDSASMSLPVPDIRATTAEELIGQTLSGRFRLDSLIGHGAMGAVFKAHHLGLHKDVALKILHRELTANDEMVARFDREAAAASRLDHPNCVRTMDFGSTDDGRRYLVMEYLEGSDLADIVTGPMPPFRVVDLIRQVLEGLAHAHAQGLVHRDIKQENIFLIGGETGDHIKLLDFGIAKVSYGAGAAQLTQAGIIFGTPHYMSPEQARGEKTDARSDLYSLGVVMHSMLSGVLPFEGEDPVALLRSQISQDPPKLPDSVPGSLRHFVMQLMAKNPDDRFADAPEAVAALRRAASPTERSATPEVPPPPKLDRRPEGQAGMKPDTLAYTEADHATSDEAPASSAAQDAIARQGTERREPDDADAEGSATRELFAVKEDDEPEAGSPGSPAPVVSDRTKGGESENAPASEPGADRPPWLRSAIGAGAVALLALAVVAWPDGDDAQSKPKSAAVEDASKDGDEAQASDESDKAAAEADEPSPPPGGDEDEPQAQSERALQATLASIDALIESKKYESARISIGPLLEVYADKPELHWRMGTVLVALDRSGNATAALKSYRLALSLKPDLLEDEGFSGTFWDLLDDPRHRELSTEIAVELLGDQGHDRLARWVNVQQNPLPYASRQAATDHLRAAQQGKRINEPLQTALDLWQAKAAPTPCDAFGTALLAATQNPDSYLLGTLARVSVPKTGEGDQETECPGLAEALTSAQTDYAQRYAGLDPVIPAAYRPRKSPARSNTNRRRRR